MNTKQKIQLIVGLFVGFVSVNVQAGAAHGVKMLDSDSKMEAGGLCSSGACFGKLTANGMEDFQRLLHKVTIFETDDRVIVPRTGKDIGFASIATVIPNQPIGNPNFDPKDPSRGPKVLKDSWGSGTVVSPCFVVSAYHVTHGDAEPPNPKDQKAVKAFQKKYAVTVMAGPGGEEGLYKVVATPVRWDKKADKVLLQMPNSECLGLAPDVGWMEIDPTLQNEVGSLRVASAGVPGDKDTSHFWMDPSCEVYGFIDNGRKMKHDCASRGGDSGGTLFRFHPRTGLPVMVGMNLAEDRPKKGSEKDLGIDASKVILPKFSYDNEQYGNIALNAADIMNDWGDLIREDIAKHNVKNPALVAIEQTNRIKPVSATQPNMKTAPRKRNSGEDI